MPVISADLLMYLLKGSHLLKL